jgi:hypothetical protein
LVNLAERPSRRQRHLPRPRWCVCQRRGAWRAWRLASGGSVAYRPQLC